MGGQWSRKYSDEVRLAAVLSRVRDNMSREEIGRKYGMSLPSLDAELARWRRANPDLAAAYARGEDPGLTADPRPAPDDLNGRMAQSIRRLLDMVEAETDQMAANKDVDLGRLEKLAKIQKLVADLVKTWASAGKPEKPPSALDGLAADLPTSTLTPTQSGPATR